MRLNILSSGLLDPIGTSRVKTSFEDCQLREVPILLGSLSERLERCCCFFQFMRSPNLGAIHTETV